uniref:Uncharacterized protein n=1 Tax=Rhizophora mucronata TaxID=61149 RepID=A0A2P2PVN9_RHIMU
MFRSGLFIFFPIPRDLRCVLTVGNIAFYLYVILKACSLCLGCGPTVRNTHRLVNFNFSALVACWVCFSTHMQ